MSHEGSPAPLDGAAVCELQYFFERYVGCARDDATRDDRRRLTLDIMQDIGELSLDEAHGEAMKILVNWQRVGIDDTDDDVRAVWDAVDNGILDWEIDERDAVADVDHGKLCTAFTEEKRAYRFRAFLTELLRRRREGGSIGND
jgi:hypothetical protein